MSPRRAAKESSIPDLLRSTARERPAETAIVSGGRSVDFATVDRASDAVAAELARRGIEKGDRVGLYCPNSDAFAIAYSGLVKAGAAAVPINLLLNPKEVAYILRDAEARALFYGSAFRPAVDAVRASLPALTLGVEIGGGAPPPGDLAFADVVAAGGRPPEVRFDPSEDVAAILYTSGTTGKPKGAMLTHRNLVANTFSIREALRLESGRDRILVVLPMFHSFAATVGMLFPLLHGCSFVPLARFDPEAVARAVEETRATVFIGVPSMYASFLRLGDEHVRRFEPLRFCVSGGAALPLEVLERFEARFSKTIYEGDGPTECSPVTCVNPVFGLRKKGSVGVPIPGVDMEIRGEDGRELARGEVGEICVRGPNVMKGYWKRPEETRESFFGEWFRTGDLGYEDDDGYFYIVDRKKDMIIVNGMNVYPRAIEEVLYQIPAVREAAVVGEPHRLHGEIPVAYVALKEGAEATEESIRHHCREHLGRHEIPRKVVLVPELPKSASGKILKRELRRGAEFERGVEAVETA